MGENRQRAEISLSYDDRGSTFWPKVLRMNGKPSSKMVGIFVSFFRNTFRWVLRKTMGLIVHRVALFYFQKCVFCVE